MVLGFPVIELKNKSDAHSYQYWHILNIEEKNVSIKIGVCVELDGTWIECNHSFISIVINEQSQRTKFDFVNKDMPYSQHWWLSKFVHNITMTPDNPWSTTKS